MKQMHLAIIGYGIMGRLLAWQAAKAGLAVSVFEASEKSKPGATAFAAGGMVAPLSEMESCEELVSEIGEIGLSIWKKYESLFFSQQSLITSKGSLIVSHIQDRSILKTLEDRLQSLSQDRKFTQWYRCKPQEIECGISNSFQDGVYLPEEMHINPQLMMNELEKRAADLGVNIQWSHPIDNLSTAPNIGSKVFDWVIDCRGLGARSKTYLNQLRGVRGEALLVHAPEVHLSRPVRVLHPRYALYVVPRSRQRYYLGATQIESESDKKITVRSSLEILSAAFALHSGFAEAQIEKSFIGLRPAFDDNLPNIRYWHTRRLISLNGLFRHGFLLAPALCEVALNLIQDQPIVSCMDKIIIEEQEFYD